MLVSRRRRTRALVLLTLHNATVTLLTHRSRVGAHEELYLPSTAVLAAEVIKAILSCLVLAREYRAIGLRKKSDGDDAGDYEGKTTPSNGKGYLMSLTSPLVEGVLRRPDELYKLCVPSVVYAFQNNLLYVGLSNLPATVFQVTYQLRILATALFSVIFFGRRYSSAKWLSLVILTIGVAVVQIPSTSGASHHTTYASNTQNRFLGFSATMTACVSSAIGGCYFEAILKPAPPAASCTGRYRLAPPSLAMRNFQLALVSIPFAAIGILVSAYDRSCVLHHGFFHRWTPLTWFVILNQAFGGLLIAAVVKEADSVSKGFATSAALLLSTVVMTIVTGTLPNPQTLIGGALVILATALFAVT